jgi:hypothetical protein
MYTWLKPITKLANKDKNVIIGGKKATQLPASALVPVFNTQTVGFCYQSAICFVYNSRGPMVSGQPTGQDAACYVQPSPSLPRFWLKSVRQIEERENTRIHTQLLTRKQDRNEIILYGSVGWKCLMKHIYKPPPIHFAFVWLQIRIPTT